MKKLLMLLVAGLLVFAACGDDDSSGAGDCDALVDDGIEVFQEILDAMDEYSLEELATLGEEELPEPIERLETRTDQLQADADRLGCTDEELQAGFAAKVDQLEAGGAFSEIILEGLKSEIESGAFFTEE